MVKPELKNKHLCILVPVSNGSRQPLHVEDLFFDPKGDRVGRRVHVVMVLLQLMPVNRSTVKWRDEKYNKRNKGCKRQRKVSELSTKYHKLGEAPIVSLKQSRYYKYVSTRGWSFNPDGQSL